MGFFSKFFGKKEDAEVLSDQELIEAGVCPNCWGHEEYAGRYKAALKDQTKSNISGDKQGKKAFVQQFIENNVTGIRLKKEGNKLQCPTCKTKYKYVSSEAK